MYLLIKKISLQWIHLRIMSSILKPVRRTGAGAAGAGIGTTGVGVGCCGDCCGGCEAVNDKKINHFSELCSESRQSML